MISYLVKFYMFHVNKLWPILRFEQQQKQKKSAQHIHLTFFYSVFGLYLH